MPDFCYYEALELEKTATQLDVTTSYKKLALQHHPDRDPGNPDATANFQKIQAAHETLSDPAKRATYDKLIAGAGQAKRHRCPFASSDDSSGSNDGFDDEDDSCELCTGEIFLDNPDFLSSPAFLELLARFEAKIALAMESAAEPLKDYRAKQQELESLRDAKEKAKIADEMEKKDAFENREKLERNAQIKRWDAANATTEAEKQGTCQHSEFWPKVQQKKKFKCESCGKKRGMVAFKCPHCALLACQVCLANFNAKRHEGSGLD